MDEEEEEEGVEGDTSSDVSDEEESALVDSAKEFLYRPARDRKPKQRFDIEVAIEVVL